MPNLELTPEQRLRFTWDWTFLNPAIRVPVDDDARISDMDGWLETKNNFLFLEAKHVGNKVFNHPSQFVPKGQLIALSRLARQPRTTVLIIYGHAPNSVFGWFDLTNRIHYAGKYSTDLVNYIYEWFSKHNRWGKNGN